VARFSVVIPVFNREESLRKSIDSIVAQTTTDYEVIVVDDGSTDRSCDVARSYEFVRLIEQENAGPGTARNRGVAEATGEYIAFLDSDDVWFPWTLSLYSKAIDQFDNPAFVTGKPFCFEDESELGTFNESASQFDAYADYFSCSERWLWHGVSSFVIRRDVFEEVGGFAEGRINGEDAELAMRLGDAKGFVHVAAPSMFGYRVHPGNITNDLQKSRAGLQLLINNERKGKFPGGSTRKRERETIISRHVRPFTVAAARRGHWRDALNFYRHVLPESLREVRLRFLLGVPLLAVVGAFRKVFQKKQATR